MNIKEELQLLADGEEECNTGVKLESEKEVVPKKAKAKPKKK